MIPDPQTWKKQSSAGLFALRTNSILKEIDRLVEKYHRIPNDSSAYLKKTAILAALYSRTRIYLTQHRDKEARKAAVSDLKNKAKQELKSLQPPERPRTPGEKLRTAIQIYSRANVGGGFRPTIPMHDQAYMLEAFGQSHLVADTLKEQFQKWLDSHTKAAASGSVPPPGSFWEWLEKNGGTKFAKQVVYLSESEREDYRVDVRSSGLSWALCGKHLHTIGLDQSVGGFDAHSFIFVISAEKKLYAGETIQGEFHHSSFLGGRPVLAAGQIQVNKGLLARVTNVSGHYRPDLSRHYNALLFFQINGVDLSRVQSQAVGFQPEEASAKEHLDKLHAQVNKVNGGWKMDPAKKLELFRAMTPYARQKFLAERGMTVSQYEASLVGSVFGPAAPTGAPRFLQPKPLS